MGILTPDELAGNTTGTDLSSRDAQLEKIVAALNNIVNIDSSAVKVLVTNLQVPCAVEMEDVKGITVKTVGSGIKHQVWLTSLSLLNAAVHAITGKGIAVEFDDDGKPKFIVD